MVDTSQIQEWARLGAQARIKELTEEIKAILELFPDIEGGALSSSERSEAALPAVAKLMDPAPKRKRSGWSAEKRQAVAVRMKKYWAARRKAKAA
jgi:hypothetical protein